MADFKSKDKPSQAPDIQSQTRAKPMVHTAKDEYTPRSANIPSEPQTSTGDYSYGGNNDYFTTSNTNRHDFEDDTPNLDRSQKGTFDHQDDNGRESSLTGKLKSAMGLSPSEGHRKSSSLDASKNTASKRDIERMTAAKGQTEEVTDRTGHTFQVTHGLQENVKYSSMVDPVVNTDDVEKSNQHMQDLRKGGAPYSSSTGGTAGMGDAATSSTTSSHYEDDGQKGRTNYGSSAASGTGYDQGKGSNHQPGTYGANRGTGADTSTGAGFSSSKRSEPTTSSEISSNDSVRHKNLAYHSHDPAASGTSNYNKDSSYNPAGGRAQEAAHDYPINQSGQQYSNPDSPSTATKAAEGAGVGGLLAGISSYITGSTNPDDQETTQPPDEGTDAIKVRSKDESGTAGYSNRGTGSNVTAGSGTGQGNFSDKDPKLSSGSYSQSAPPSSSAAGTSTGQSQGIDYDKLGKQAKSAGTQGGEQLEKAGFSEHSKYATGASAAVGGGAGYLAGKQSSKHSSFEPTEPSGYKASDANKSQSTPQRGETHQGYQAKSAPPVGETANADKPHYMNDSTMPESYNESHALHQNTMPSSYNKAEGESDAVMPGSFVSGSSPKNDSTMPHGYAAGSKPVGSRRRSSSSSKFGGIVGAVVGMVTGKKRSSSSSSPQKESNSPARGYSSTDPSSGAKAYSSTGPTSGTGQPQGYSSAEQSQGFDYDKLGKQAKSAGTQGGEQLDNAGLGQHSKYATGAGAAVGAGAGYLAGKQGSKGSSSVDPSNISSNQGYGSDEANRDKRTSDYSQSGQAGRVDKYPTFEGRKQGQSANTQNFASENYQGDSSKSKIGPGAASGGTMGAGEAILSSKSKDSSVNTGSASRYPDPTADSSTGGYDRMEDTGSSIPGNSDGYKQGYGSNAGTAGSGYGMSHGVGKSASGSYYTSTPSKTVTKGASGGSSPTKSAGKRLFGKSKGKDDDAVQYGTVYREVHNENLYASANAPKNRNMHDVNDEGLGKDPGKRLHDPLTASDKYEKGRFNHADNAGVAGGTVGAVGGAVAGSSASKHAGKQSSAGDSTFTSNRDSSSGVKSANDDSRGAPVSDTYADDYGFNILGTPGYHPKDSSGRSNMGDDTVNPYSSSYNSESVHQPIDNYGSKKSSSLSGGSDDAYGKQPSSDYGAQSSKASKSDNRSGSATKGAAGGGILGAIVGAVTGKNGETHPSSSQGYSSTGPSSTDPTLATGQSHGYSSTSGQTASTGQPQGFSSTGQSQGFDYDKFGKQAKSAGTQGGEQLDKAGLGQHSKYATGAGAAVGAGAGYIGDKQASKDSSSRGYSSTDPSSAKDFTSTDPSSGSKGYSSSGQSQGYSTVGGPTSSTAQSQGFSSSGQPHDYSSADQSQGYSSAGQGYSSTGESQGFDYDKFGKQAKSAGTQGGEQLDKAGLGQHSKYATGAGAAVGAGAGYMVGKQSSGQGDLQGVSASQAEASSQQQQAGGYGYSSSDAKQDSDVSKSGLVDSQAYDSSSPSEPRHTGNDNPNLSPDDNELAKRAAANASAHNSSTQGKDARFADTSNTHTLNQEKLEQPSSGDKEKLSSKMKRILKNL